MTQLKSIEIYSVIVLFDYALPSYYLIIV